MDKLVGALAVVGAVLGGLPVILRGILLILKAIPGPAGEAQVEKLLALSEKASELANKLYPLPK